MAAATSFRKVAPFPAKSGHTKIFSENFLTQKLHGYHLLIAKCYIFGCVLGLQPFQGPDLGAALPSDVLAPLSTHTRHAFSGVESVKLGPYFHLIPVKEIFCETMVVNYLS